MTVTFEGILADLARRAKSPAGQVKSGPAKDYGPDIASAVQSVEVACHSAVSADSREAAAVFAASALLGPAGAVASAALVAFESRAGGLTRSLIAAAEGLTHFVTHEISEHHQVPLVLSDDDIHWKELSARAQKVRLEARQLEKVKGWVGPDADEYAAAVRVQLAALGELSTVMNEVGNSCKEAGTANEIAFFQLIRLLKAAENTIRRDSRSGGSLLYTRTARGISVLQELMPQVAPTTLAAYAEGTLKGDVAGQAFGSLDILRPDFWPTGTSAAGISTP